MMHRPPAWALDGGERVSLEEFQRTFGEAWRRIGRRFLKVECWQSYQEADGVRSQEAFQKGDVDLARRLLEEEAKDDQPLYDEVKARGLEFTRVRLVTPPLTDYLRYEMINYEIRSRLGENVEFIVPPSPVEDYFDFLLFDADIALIHDYGDGPVGYQVGGWITRVPATLGALANIVDELRAEGTPVTEAEFSPDASGR
ncbi:DUF6879 family protein [Actinomadura violacea]|uniref:DUF6879 domain-containing protein n=1 Tax=Actinomadura violacea TaxID=2819934 RepID=A0ABS3RPJ3_9ACTN|nr:DUF6879 family protein [Actinomadura violacea]MBO2458556.1 hypothetical protein [Actinomadura violacea]